MVCSITCEVLLTFGYNVYMYDMQISHGSVNRKQLLNARSWLKKHASKVNSNQIL